MITIVHLIKAYYNHKALILFSLMPVALEINLTLAPSLSKFLAIISISSLGIVARSSNFLA